MIRLLIQLLFELMLFALLPATNTACLVCCGRHAAANFLRLPPPPSSSSTILFDTNAAALNPSWQGQGQQQLYHIPRDVSKARYDDTTIIANMESLSSYVHNTDWKHLLLAGKDSFLLNSLGENYKEDSNIIDGETAPPRLLQENEENTGKNGENNAEETTQEEEEEVSMTTAMVASIGFYKRFISPLLPPACRFFPTCSQYGVQAIKEFGPCQGGLLTAWRLLRCSPFGGKGYDPPKWPPVPYTYSSY